MPLRRCASAPTGPRVERRGVREGRREQRRRPPPAAARRRERLDGLAASAWDEDARSARVDRARRRRRPAPLLRVDLDAAARKTRRAWPRRPVAVNVVLRRRRRRAACRRERLGFSRRDRRTRGAKETSKIRAVGILFSETASRGRRASVSLASQVWRRRRRRPRHAAARALARSLPALVYIARRSVEQTGDEEADAVVQDRTFGLKNKGKSAKVQSSAESSSRRARARAEGHAHAGAGAARRSRRRCQDEGGRGAARLFSDALTTDPKKAKEKEKQLHAATARRGGGGGGGKRGATTTTTRGRSAAPERHRPLGRGDGSFKPLEMQIEVAPKMKAEGKVGTPSRSRSRRGRNARRSGGARDRGEVRPSG